MEAIAWQYIEKGDVGAASTIFTTLAQSSGPKQQEHRRMARLCRVLRSPLEVPLPHRHGDVVDALLESRIPVIAVFGPCTHFSEAARAFNRLVPHVHPDKNPHARAAAAFQRLQEMKNECQQLLPCGDDAPEPASPLSPSGGFGGSTTEGTVATWKPREDVGSTSGAVSAPTKPSKSMDRKRQPLARKVTTDEVKVQRQRSRQLTGLLRSMRQQGVRRLECDLSVDAFEAEKARAEPTPTNPAANTTLTNVSVDGASDSDCASGSDTDPARAEKKTVDVILDGLRSRRDAGEMSDSLCDTVSSSIAAAMSGTLNASMSLSEMSSTVRSLSSFDASASANSSACAIGATNTSSDYIRRQRSVALLRSRGKASSVPNTNETPSQNAATFPGLPRTVVSLTVRHHVAKD